MAHRKESRLKERDSATAVERMLTTYRAALSQNIQVRASQGRPPSTDDIRELNLEPVRRTRASD